MAVFDVTAPSAGIHAWSAGAVGIMTLAAMSLASLGHTGRALVATPALEMIYSLAVVAALARVCAALHPDWSGFLLHLAAFTWAAAFLGFAGLQAPLLCRPKWPAVRAGR